MNEKRQRLVNTALHLFYEHGINSIGINEVLKVSGVAKKTLYNHFQSKEELILAALEQRHHVFLAWFEKKLEGASCNQELVEKLFTALKSWFDDSEPTLGHFRGCFFINSAAEFSDPNSVISQYCCQHKQDVRDVIEAAMVDLDTSLLDAICIMKEGAICTAYITGDNHVAEQCISIINIRMNDS